MLAGHICLLDNHAKGATMSAAEGFRHHDKRADVLDIYTAWLRAKKDREGDFHNEVGKRVLRLIKQFGVESTERSTVRDDELGLMIEEVKTIVHSKPVDLDKSSALIGARLHVERAIYPLLPFSGLLARAAIQIPKTGLGKVHEITIDYIDQHEHVNSVSLNKWEFGETVPFGHESGFRTINLTAKDSVNSFLEVLGEVEDQTLSTQLAD